MHLEQMTLIAKEKVQLNKLRLLVDGHPSRCREMRQSGVEIADGLSSAFWLESDLAAGDGRSNQGCCDNDEHQRATHKSREDGTDGDAAA